MDHKNEIDLILSNLDVEPNLDRINKKCNINKNILPSRTTFFRPVYISLIIIITLLLTLNIVIISIYFDGKYDSNINSGFIEEGIIEDENEDIGNNKGDENVPGNDNNGNNDIESDTPLNPEVYMTTYEIYDQLFDSSENMKPTYDSSFLNNTMVTMNTIKKDIDGNIIDNTVSCQKIEKIILLESPNLFQVELDNGLVFFYNALTNVWEEVK